MTRGPNTETYDAASILMDLAAQHEIEQTDGAPKWSRTQQRREWK